MPHKWSHTALANCVVARSWPKTCEDNAERSLAQDCGSNPLGPGESKSKAKAATVDNARAAAEDNIETDRRTSERSERMGWDGMG